MSSSDDRARSGIPRHYSDNGTPLARAVFNISMAKLPGAFRHLTTNVTALTSIDTPNLPISTPFGTLFPGPLAVVNAQLTTTQSRVGT
jgi:hypothetical protein